MRELSGRYGLDVDPDALVGDLPVGVQQRVEILKALARDADVLILDEPTAVLTPQEIDDLIRVMRDLRDGGTSIVFITHKLREVKAVADRITVIRRGKVVGEADPARRRDRTGQHDGRPRRAAGRGQDAVRGPARSACASPACSSADDRGQVTVDGSDLDVHCGEIVALAGVQGNGQEELVEAMLGVRPADLRLDHA